MPSAAALFATFHDTASGAIEHVTLRSAKANSLKVRVYRTYILEGMKARAGAYLRAYFRSRPTWPRRPQTAHAHSAKWSCGSRRPHYTIRRLLRSYRTNRQRILQRLNKESGTVPDIDRHRSVSFLPGGAFLECPSCSLLLFLTARSASSRCPVSIWTVSGQPIDSLSARKIRRTSVAHRSTAHLLNARRAEEELLSRSKMEHDRYALSYIYCHPKLK